MIDMTTAALADQRAVSWSQGRMELLARSRLILGDPRSPNLKVKYRESLRPFAPSAGGSKV